MIWEVGQFVLIWRQGGESLQILASLWRSVTNVQIDPVDEFYGTEVNWDLAWDVHIRSWWNLKFFRESFVL